MIGLEFIFVHSYSSNEANWRGFSICTAANEGRFRDAFLLSEFSDTPVIANDVLDKLNQVCFVEIGIENLCTAQNTRSEVVSALLQSKNGRVVFVTSPDQLQRVARDVVWEGETKEKFGQSEISVSDSGPTGFKIKEIGSSSLMAPF